MAKAVHRLSARQVATLKEPGRYADGGNLYLVVDPSGARRWVFIYRFSGRRREMGLGGTLAVSLADARERADAARRMIAAGVDPLAAGKARPVPTFGAVAESFMNDNAASWRNAVHRRQWRQTLEEHAAALWTMPVDQVGPQDVLAVLRPLWQAKPETASRLRGRIERVLDAARVGGHRTGENPARWRGHLALVLPKPAKLTRGHHAAMPYEKVPAFVAALRERPADTARMLEFAILTAARSGEVRRMEAGEVDLDAGIWTVPAARMKAGREHRVPLSSRAVEILRAQGIGGGLVFPSSTGRPYSDMVFTALFRRMGVTGVTAHGFRSSFRDWAGDKTDHAREVIEAALAHIVGDKAERAYRRSDALEKRRALLHDWTDFIGSASR